MKTLFIINLILAIVFITVAVYTLFCKNMGSDCKFCIFHNDENHHYDDFDIFDDLDDDQYK